MLDFMGRYYEMNPRLGSPLEEKTLGAAIDSLKGANSEAVVQFLHITLNNLSSLLVRPTVTEESADIPSKAFESMSSLVQRVQKLDLPTDKHGRNGILSSYVQYVFSAPLAQHNPGAFDSRTATLKGRHGSTEGGDYMSSASAASAAFKKGGSVRGTKGVSFNSEWVCGGTKGVSFNSEWVCGGTKGVSFNSEWVCGGTKGVSFNSEWVCGGAKGVSFNSEWVCLCLCECVQPM